MKIDVTIYLRHEEDGVLRTKLDAILRGLGRLQSAQESFFTQLNREIHQMAGELDTLTTAIQENSDAEDSAIVLLSQLSDLIRATANDPAKVIALADQVNAKRAALAAALVANTPAA